MKRLLIKIITLTLVLTLLCSGTLGVLAAPSRKPGNVSYLSEVALIEAANKEEADKIFAELKKPENGGFTGMIEMDLNEGGSRKVYMAFKTSNDVDDAITDLAVMNMNGDYNIGSYEQILAECFEEYKINVEDYRIMANEFAKNYRNGYREAQIAYRQLNYYYDGTQTVDADGKITWTVDTKMGDYMLNFPEDNDDFAYILFKGNLNILANIRALLAMGVGDPDRSLVERVIEKTKDESVYKDAKYYDDAKYILNTLISTKKSISSYEEQIKEIQNMKPSKYVTQEDIDALVQMAQNSLNVELACINALKEIPFGDTTLGDYIMNTANIKIENLYPLVAAMTPGELALAQRGQIRSLMVYDVVEMKDYEIEEILAEVEKDFKELPVYYGSDMNPLNGTVAITGDALLNESSTGNSWLTAFNVAQSEEEYRKLDYVESVLMGAGGALVIIESALLMKKLADGNAAIHAAQFADTAMIYDDIALITADMPRDGFAVMIEGADGAADYIAEGIRIGDQSMDDLFGAADDLAFQANRVPANTGAYLKGGQLAAGVVGITIGLLMIGYSIYNIITLECADHVEYTAIPDNMVDTVKGIDGERFINYYNVPSYYYKDGKLTTRNNDLNGYQGNQWVSMYYTKNYEAGYCMTSTPDLIANESPRTGYSPVHIFGNTSNYNLNSYCNREGAKEVFLAFKYSTNQKSAVADIPDVIGSSFNVGVVAISGFAGLVLGLGIMWFIMKKRATVTNF